MLNMIVFRVGQYVGDMNGPVLELNPPANAASTRARRVPLNVLRVLAGDVIGDCQAKETTVEPNDQSLFSSAQSGRVLDESLQDGLEVKR
jgi:hypothetical protein